MLYPLLAIVGVITAFIFYLKWYDERKLNKVLQRQNEALIEQNKRLAGVYLKKAA